MKYCRNRDINNLVKRLVQDGWTFCWGGKHGKLYRPLGEFAITVPASPSDHRAFLNFKRDLRYAARAPERESMTFDAARTGI